MTKIQLRHDTAANWTSVNPILLEGEVGIETDTRKQKFGDGVTAWNSLPYDKGSTALQSITSSDVTNALGYTPVNQSLSNLDSEGQDKFDVKMNDDYSNADYEPANQSLSNLNSTGRAVIDGKANVDLSNVTGAGQTLLNKITAYPKKYQYNGAICNSSGDTARSVGGATIILYGNGLAEIQFVCKMTSGGSANNVYTWGVNRDFFYNAGLGIPQITPINLCGTCHYFAGNSVLDTDLTGYGGTFVPNNQFWTPARVYTEAGAIGPWPSNRIGVTTYIVGTCYGTYTVGSEG